MSIGDGSIKSVYFFRSFSLSLASPIENITCKNSWHFSNFPLHSQSIITVCPLVSYRLRKLFNVRQSDYKVYILAYLFT